MYHRKYLEEDIWNQMQRLVVTWVDKRNITSETTLPVD